MAEGLECQVFRLAFTCGLHRNNEDRWVEAWKKNECKYLRRSLWGHEEWVELLSMNCPLFECMDWSFISIFSPAFYNFSPSLWISGTRLFFFYFYESLIFWEQKFCTSRINPTLQITHSAIQLWIELIYHTQFHSTHCYLCRLLLLLYFLKTIYYSVWMCR